MSTAVETCEDILQTLSEKGLLTPSALAQAQALGQKSSRGPRQLTSELVEKGLLTRFQADCVLRGAAGQLTLSQYVLVDVLGTGSMGTAYKARSAKDDSWYVVKTVPRKNVINLKTIVEKVEALKQVRHPRVSAMAAIGAHADRVFMVWPMIEGGTRLDEVIARGGKLPARQAAQVALQIALGLEAYHEHDLFHGLLKPGDVLIGSDRRVRILDFGVGFLLTCERGKSLLSTMTNG